MSAPRLKRADRLVELRERALQEAEGHAAAATRAVVEAKAKAQEAERLWQATAASLAPIQVADLAEADAYLRTLKVRADRALTEVVTKRTEEERFMRELLAAKAEVRKLEIWRDGIRAGIDAHAERLERQATDAIAARRARGTP